MSINYERRGSGPPLVLVHGLGGSLVVWRPVVELLAAERDVIAVDLPGFGKSDPLPTGTKHSAREMGRALSSFLLDDLGIGAPHLAGNSLGAWTVLEMAADGNAASVACISPAGLWRMALGPRAYNTRKAGMRLRGVVHAALRSRRLRNTLMRTTVARPDRLTGDEAIEWADAWLDAPSYDDANSMMRKTPFERAAGVRVPVSIAWGESDRLVAPPRPERMPAQTRFEKMPGWGHTPTHDDPAGVAEFLLGASRARAEPGPPATLRET